ncbi:MAG: D-glycero-beta-D-manno-heptose 1-phosphate adenylyltransferase [Acidithiobacillus sp.]|nr:D-glycero-beta-D-manno-heptose 1-phosphate adenylyltransferase [Acidithiobacillus sp.]MDD5375558.1 D-glycero-beta-D-manno-heptose 1-phosphate adenylyltransferase [Acidithiobacillus sp.]
MINPDFFITSIEEAQHSIAECTNALPDVLACATQAIIDTLRRGNKVLTCGNGGSAGDAQHIASELVNRFETERSALAAVSLVPDSSVVTAIANDYAYEVIFSRQIEALGREGDILIAFSTSGNSRNILRAIESAHLRKMIVIAMTGNDGGQVTNLLSQFDVEVRAPAYSTARVQEIHLLAIHAICQAIDTHLTEPDLVTSDKVQTDWHQLVSITRGLRPLVFTNGVFDILHRGHITYLKKARAMGACLIVGVNSDASSRRLGKGPERPVQSEDDRAHILAGLSCVDFVTLFDEDTPEQLIETLEPDILVKGGDYVLKDIIGADFVLARGGAVETVAFEYDRSTTGIVRHLKHLT